MLALAAAVLWKRQHPPQAPGAALTAEQLQRLRREAEAEFRSADRNGDGYLSPDEVRGRFPLIAREFQRLDTDHDGRISLPEFIEVRRMQIEKRFMKQ